MMRAVAFITAMMGATAAPAQENCGSYVQIAERLAGDYEEQRAFQGLSTSGHALEVWAAPGIGSWTVVLVTPDGMGCVLDAGVSGFVRLPVAGEGL